MLLVQGKDFDSYDNVDELASGYCFDEYGEDELVNSKVLNSVKSVSKYKIGEEIRVDFNGDGSITWNGEITGIFENKLMVYIY